MAMNRRDFVKGSAVAAAGITVSSTTVTAQEAQTNAVFKPCSQEGIIPGDNLRRKVERMEQWGFVGLEVWGGGLAGRVKEIQDALKGTKVKLSAICAGYQGVPMSHDPEVRKQFMASAKEILKPAGELGSTGLIIVPAFNGQTELNHVEGRKVLCDLLPELGDAAQVAGTRILLEPLNRGEAWFLRQVADAAAICRDVNHPAICVMGDFYHMYIEEPSDMAAFLAAGDRLHHVHIACIDRNLPGQDPRDFRNGFKGLKAIGYQDYCSYECGVKGDPLVEIPKSLKVLQQHWDEA